MSDGEQPLRARLIDSGLALLEEGGIGAVGLRAVARRAGVSHGAPRRYFPTHRVLLAAIAAAGLDELSDRLAAADACATDPVRERLHRMAVHYVAFGETRSNLFELMFRHDLLEGSGLELRERSRPLFEAFTAVLAETGVASPSSVALNLWTQLHGFVVLRATGSIEVIAGQIDLDGFVSQLIELHLRSGR